MSATATAPKPNPTQQIMEKLDGLAGRIEKSESVIDGLLKVLQQPASKVGMTPEQFFAKMTAGSQASVIGSDGAVTPVALGPALRDRRLKSVGWGQFLKAIWSLDAKSTAPEQAAKSVQYLTSQGVEKVIKVGDTIRKAALAESSGVTGGYTVPTQWSQQLLMLAVEDMIVAPRAAHQPMDSLSMQVPSLDHTTVQGAGHTPFLGGVQGTWTAEGQTRSESEPSFRMTELKANELSFYAVSSNEMLADSMIALETLLTLLFKNAIAWYRDYAYLQGNGVGKPLGMTNSPATIAVNRNAANQFKWVDAYTMMGRLYGLESWRNGATVWVMHPSVLPQLLNFTDAGGRLIFQPLNQGAQEMPAASSGPYSAGYLFGIPCVFTEKLPALGTRGDVLLLDCSKYLLGDREELVIDVSTHVLFLKNQTAWRMVWRGDGQPWLNSPITLADGTFTVSPFVILN